MKKKLLWLFNRQSDQDDPRQPSMLEGSEHMKTLSVSRDVRLDVLKAEAEAMRLSLLRSLDGEDIRGLIPAGARINGTIRSLQGLKIDGQVAGSVEMVGNALLVIAPTAEIMGSIKAKRAIVLGTVHGGAAVDSLVIYQQAKIRGEVRYLAVRMVGVQPKIEEKEEEEEETGQNQDLLAQASE